MMLFLALAHVRIAMALSLRHYRRGEAASQVGDFAAMHRHFAKGRKGRARVERLMDRIERRLPPDQRVSA